MLVVDDKPRIVEKFLRYSAKSRLLEATRATSGAKALRTMARNPPPVLVLHLETRQVTC